jgi:hypothetical protein
MNKQAAEKRLADFLMDDLPIMEFIPRPSVVAPDWFAKYKSLRNEFIKTLTDSIEELAFLNLSQDEFMGLVTGRAIPRNLSIRFRVPLQWGGKLELNNLFMCSTFPHSHNINRFIIEQTTNPAPFTGGVIWLPNPAKKIYVPAHMSGGGDGGNATEDRLRQMAAQYASGRE